MLFNEVDSKHDIDSIVNCEVNMEERKNSVPHQTSYKIAWFVTSCIFLYFIDLLLMLLFQRFVV